MKLLQFLTTKPHLIQVFRAVLLLEAEVLEQFPLQWVDYQECTKHSW